MAVKKYAPVLAVLVSLTAAPCPAAPESYVTSGEFLAPPFDAPRFVSALSSQEARRSFESRIP